jgi:hypothetical protein
MSLLTMTAPSSVVKNTNILNIGIQNHLNPIHTYPMTYLETLKRAYWMNLWNG